MDTPLQHYTDQLRLTLHDELVKALREAVVLMPLTTDRRVEFVRQAVKLLAKFPVVSAMPYICSMCGQHITDGKPCGCGARGSV